MFPSAGDSPPFTYHLGQAYLQAYLSKSGFSSRQILPGNGCTIDECAKELLSTNASVIGFTCYDKNYPLVKKIASVVKDRLPGAVIVVGGPSATFSDEIMLRDAPAIDVCVRFEGEQTARELMSSVFEGSFPEGLDRILGISFRRGRSIIRNPDRPLFGLESGRDSSLDGLPSPYLERVLSGRENTGVLTARGCINRCTYCNFSALSRHTVRYHSIERVISELMYIESARDCSPSTKNQDQIVPILDDSFAINVQRAKRICEAIAREEIKLRLSCLIRAENIDRELMELIANAGFVEVCFGVESAVPRILRNVRRVTGAHSQIEGDGLLREKEFLEKVREGVSLAKEHGIKACVSFVLGLPGETLEDGLATVSFIESLQADYCAQNHLGVYRGTELYDTAGDFGLRLIPSPSSLECDCVYPYPLQEIPVCKNSSLQEDKARLADTVADAFAGGTEGAWGSGVLTALVERPKPAALPGVIGWLSKNLSVAGRAIILGDRNDELSDLRATAEECLKSGLPTSRLCLLKSYTFPGSKAAYEVFPLRGQMAHFGLKFALLKLNGCLRSSWGLFAKDDQVLPVYCIDDREDLLFLAAMARMLAKDAGVHDGMGELWLNGCLLDGCRWSCGDQCPANDLRRVIISRDGRISACLTGEPFGTVYEGAEVIRSRVEAIRELVWRSRGCDSCRLGGECSRCLFPGRFDQQEYCDLQNSDLRISEIVKNSKVASRIWRNRQRS